MARLARIGLVLLATAGGVAIGRGTVASPAASPTERCAPAPAPVAATALPMIPGLDGVALRADIRRILREEIQFARLPEAVQSQVDPAPAAPMAAESGEAHAAAEQGRRIIDGALAARRWSDRDVLAIRQILPKLASDDRDALLRELLPAINSGRVSLESTGAIF